MKFIGQFIQSLVSRFRNDVFLENVSSGTIASGGNLGLDSNNKIVKANEATGDITSVTLTADSGEGIIDSSGDVNHTIAGGNAITTAIGSGNLEINHDDTSSQASVNNSGSTFIQDVTIDTYGHVTGLTSAAVPTLNQNTTGSAATLTTERDLQVNLASTSADGFDGGGNADNIGVSGTLAIGNGGTGQTTAQAALDALAGGTTAGRYLRGDGSNITLSAIQNSDIGTLNQDTTGSAATLTTARAINGVDFDGSAAITIPTRVHGSTIKILPTDFIPNEDGGTSKGVFLDDDGTTGLKAGIAQMELIAVVIIPENYKATHVDIFDNSHNLVVNVFEMNVNASGQTSKGSGNANTTIDITDVNATATNYLAIEVVTTATSERVFGGTVTIAPQ